MAARMLAMRLRLAVQNIEARIQEIFNFPPPVAPALAFHQPSIDVGSDSSSFDIKSIFDGFLWAAPKSRRSLERRRTRRRATEKRLKSKPDIVACEVCGQPKLLYHLCGNCLEKVKAETEAVREKLGKEWSWNTPQTETIVLYEGEKVSEQDKDKHIVEVPRKRPSWFTKDLYTEH
ncbi:large ribosomal subunit protein bL32m-like [Saccoglossus kowalevskii]|uniref:Large ribosomal subunit protein bL32m n=1 Tax=Saccoglossus kowalevskii TaxID=10224 RepID=A0ABM0GZ91_SACKO|nr:PREDICTED: 39S ribosomal protein L32, mitochondrial-like [Saccoglossus kowalevskii]